MTQRKVRGREAITQSVQSLEDNGLAACSPRVTCRITSRSLDTGSGAQAVKCGQSKERTAVSDHSHSLPASSSDTFPGGAPLHDHLSPPPSFGPFLVCVIVSAVPPRCLL